ncbi:MAG: 2-hydroxyacyl-CoA dehydratase [Deltaproteobacteria bacterium]|nr:2-hydroxyacyl-CoA dehydratase [Deltaproteobacteria bacterium]
MFQIEQQIEDYLNTEIRDIDGAVGWFCIDFPEEILISFGLTPIRLLPYPGPIIVDSLLDSNFCPYIRANLGNVYSGHYDFLDGLVLVNTCDGMRRLFDGWKRFSKAPFTHLFELPRHITEGGIKFYRQSILRLVSDIEDFFLLKMDEEKLSDAIRLTNRTRVLLRKLYRRYNENPGTLEYQVVQQFIRASTILPKPRINKLLEYLLSEKQDTKDGEGESPNILIIGNIMENSEFVSFLESCGAHISYDDLCTGSRLFHDDIPKDLPPLDALCMHFANRIPCSRMKEANRRIEHIVNFIGQYRIDGVISYTQKFCDPYLYDIPLIKGSLKAMGIPILFVETDYSPRLSGQLKTRIEAFLEMIE